MRMENGSAVPESFLARMTSQALHEQSKNDDLWLISLYMYSAVLSLKQKRGTYWYRGTNWNERAY